MNFFQAKESQVCYASCKFLLGGFGTGIESVNPLNQKLYNLRFTENGNACAINETEATLLAIGYGLASLYIPG